MTCGACAARIEQRLNALDGVEARVNYASERATAVLPADVSVARLIEEVTAAGYSAELPADDRTDEGGEEIDVRVRALRRRLFVSALLFMPLCDTSIAFSVAPESALPGLAVAHGGTGGAGGHVGGLAVLPGGRTGGPTRLVHHGHAGLVGHHLLDDLVALRNVLARFEPRVALDPVHAGAPLGRGDLSRRRGRRHHVRTRRAILRSVVPPTVGQCAARAWPQSAPKTSASSTPWDSSAAARCRHLPSATASSSGRGRPSPQTARWSSGSRRSTAVS